MSVILFTNGINVSTATTGSYVNTNVSANVSNTAVAAILRIQNATNQTIFIRGNGSTDDLPAGISAGLTAQQYKIVALDVNGIFQQKVSSASFVVDLVGYITSDTCIMFTNMTSKSTGTTGSYVSVNISSDASPNTAIGAIWHLTKSSTSAAPGYYIRCNGGTDDRYTAGSATTGVVCYTGFVQVDGSQIFQQKIASTALTLYLAGYLTKGYVGNINGVDRSTGTTGSYVDITALNAAAIAGHYEFNETSTTSNNVGIHSKGSTDDYYSTLGGRTGIIAGYAILNAIVGLNASQTAQQKVATTSEDLYEMGYFTTVVSTIYQLIFG